MRPSGTYTPRRNGSRGSRDPPGATKTYPTAPVISIWMSRLSSRA
jgi:hypothetical protein